MIRNTHNPKVLLQKFFRAYGASEEAQVAVVEFCRAFFGQAQSRPFSFAEADERLAERVQLAIRTLDVTKAISGPARSVGDVEIVFISAGQAEIADKQGEQVSGQEFWANLKRTFWSDLVYAKLGQSYREAFRREDGLTREKFEDFVREILGQEIEKSLQESVKFITGFQFGQTIIDNHLKTLTYFLAFVLGQNADALMRLYPAVALLAEGVIILGEDKSLPGIWYALVQ